MKTISPTNLNRLLEAQPGLVLIDVRTPIEYTEVHVPQARSVPLDTLDPKTFINNDQAVYILCRSGQRATKAAEKCAVDGFDNAVVVEGGTLAWINAGLPVQRSAVKVMSLERQVRIAAGSLVLIGTLLGWFVNPAFYGLSAFVGVGLVFAGITDFCGMGLLLAKAPWNKCTVA